MINFDSALDVAGTTRMTVKDAVPIVRETITVRPAPAEPVSKPVAEQSWEPLRDYVIEQILTSGPIPRDTRRETTIFMGFASRWGAAALPIARYAFEECGGMWLGAPVGVFRFHRTSDSCFAQEISRKIIT